jgi:hypothetical protein
VLEVNPFDQPNVQEAKDNTQRVLESGDVEEPPSADREALARLLDTGPPHYVAIMAFVQPSEQFDRNVEELRAAIRDRTRCTTTFGYGPRYLHSTGQFHKGGPPTGVFLQLIHDGDADVEIPDAEYTFKVLKNAQATGDYETLRAHDLPVERVRLDDLNTNLKELL